MWSVFFFFKKKQTYLVAARKHCLSLSLPFLADQNESHLTCERNKRGELVQMKSITLKVTLGAFLKLRTDKLPTSDLLTLYSSPQSCRSSETRDRCRFPAHTSKHEGIIPFRGGDDAVECTSFVCQPHAGNLLRSSIPSGYFSHTVDCAVIWVLHNMHYILEKSLCIVGLQRFVDFVDKNR